ncbi:DUF1648 domain-containing protein [Paenibacillus solisilvae]|uniref:DUF1648 domain-containing protein n=1 Tax=Paenibacillus solisilvae TaxID=2486751 RepID=A0ABW0W3Y7_9BACL
MNIGGWALFSLFATYLSVGALLTVMPVIGSKRMLFGVHIPDEASEDPEAASIKRRYVSNAILVSVIGLAAAVLLSWLRDGEMEAAAPAALIVQIIGNLLAMQQGRSAAIRLKAGKGWERTADSRRVVSLSFRSGKLTISSAWYTVHVILAGISVFFAVLLWDRIPATIITHYNGSFEPDGVSSKGFGSVFMLNIIQLFMTCIFLFTNTIIRIAKQQLNPNEAAKSMEKQRRFRFATSLFLYYLSLVIILLLSYIQATMLYDWSLQTLKVITSALPVAIMASLILHILYLNRKGIAQSDFTSDTEEQHWKGGGAFYSNKEDPSLFVAKRFGVGWTINMGHPLGWLVLVGILAIPIGIIVITEIL